MLDLQSIVATGDDASDNVQIQTLDAYGYTVDTYDWNDWAADKPCWVDGDWNPVEGVSIEAGQGLWVIGSAATQGFQSSGKVGVSDVLERKTGDDIEEVVGAEVAACIVAEGDDTSDNVQIQTLDAYGYTVDTYDWNDWAADKPCWVDGDWNPVEGVSIAPGQGLWIIGSSDAQSIRFPAPEL